jgi:dienelactone hydrolase
MLEKWFKKEKTNSGASGGKIPRKAFLVPAGVWIAGLAFLLAGGSPFWNYIHKPDEARLDAIADEVGSIGVMIQGHRARWLAADTPLINHAGTQVLFCQTSDNGTALFTTDLATGERKQLFEELGGRFTAGPMTLLAPFSWSPDDTKIIYSRRLQNPLSQNDSYDMVVAEAVTGRDLAAMKMPGVQKTVWLTPKSFVCIERAGHVHLIAEQPDENWKETETISIGAGRPSHGKLPLIQKQQDGSRKEMGTIPINGKYEGLAALSSDTIVWQETNQILSLDLPAKAAAVLFKLQGKQLKEFSFSKETGQFLLSCAGNGQDSLWRLTPGEQMLQDTNWIATADVSVSMWLNGGKGYVYFDKNKHLLVQTNAWSEAAKVLEHGHVSSFASTPDGKHLVVFGTASNEPACGIWEYDIAANTARCIAPAAGHGLRHVVPVTRTQHKPIHGLSGGWFDLVIYEPVPLDRHRKYPVVIVNTPVWRAQPYMTQYALAVENAGAYFMALDRRDWFDRKGFGDSWADNEAAVINSLIHEPTVDRSRIFLLSNCIESKFLGDFAAKYPWRCKGMFMLVGNGLPDPANLAAGKYPPKVFDSACDAWDGNGERLKKYQETAAQSGVEMDYIVHPNTMHDFAGIQAQRDRIRAMLHFIFDN